MDAWSEEILLKMKVSELKEELKRIKKPVYGTKLILIGRLLDYKQANNFQEISTSTPSSSQSFSFALERIEHNISDIEEEEDNNETKNAKKTSKSYCTY